MMNTLTYDIEEQIIKNTSKSFLEYLDNDIDNPRMVSFNFTPKQAMYGLYAIALNKTSSPKVKNDLWDYCFNIFSNSNLPRKIDQSENMLLMCLATKNDKYIKDIASIFTTDMWFSNFYLDTKRISPISALVDSGIKGFIDNDKNAYLPFFDLIHPSSSDCILEKDPTSFIKNLTHSGQAAKVLKEIMNCLVKYNKPITDYMFTDLINSLASNSELFHSKDNTESFWDYWSNLRKNADSSAKSVLDDFVILFINKTKFFEGRVLKAFQQTLDIKKIYPALKSAGFENHIKNPIAMKELFSSPNIVELLNHFDNSTLYFIKNDSDNLFYAWLNRYVSVVLHEDSFNKWISDGKQIIKFLKTEEINDYQLNWLRETPKYLYSNEKFNGFGVITKDILVQKIRNLWLNLFFDQDYQRLTKFSSFLNDIGFLDKTVSSLIATNTTRDLLSDKSKKLWFDLITEFNLDFLKPLITSKPIESKSRIPLSIGLSMITASINDNNLKSCLDYCNINFESDKKIKDIWFKKSLKMLINAYTEKDNKNIECIFKAIKNNTEIFETIKDNSWMKDFAELITIGDNEDRVEAILNLLISSRLLSVESDAWKDNIDCIDKNKIETFMAIYKKSIINNELSGITKDQNPTKKRII